jgi:hypothetical protein
MLNRSNFESKLFIHDLDQQKSVSELIIENIKNKKEFS